MTEPQKPVLPKGFAESVAQAKRAGAKIAAAAPKLKLPALEPFNPPRDGGRIEVEILVDIRNELRAIRALLETGGQ